MNTRLLACTFSIFMGALLAAGFLLLEAHQPALADASPNPPIATTRYVTTKGSDGGGTSPCTPSTAPCRTVQQAVNVSNSYDEIRVASGVYTGVQTLFGMSQVVYINKTVTIQGGYNPANWALPNPAANPTVLDAEGLGRVVSIGGDITPTLRGFVLTGGDASGLTTNCETVAYGCGGGIFVYGAHPIIAHNVITDNVAARSTNKPRTTGYGGGLYLSNAPRAVIDDNTIISNTASTAGCGAGGGLYLYPFEGGVAGLVVQDNRIYSSTATTTNDSCAWGGGISGGPTGVLIEGNIVQGNRANGWGGGSGAGVFQWYGSADYLDNLISGNLGSFSEAVYLGHSEAHFEGNRILDNATAAGVHLIVSEGSGPVLANNVIARSGEKALIATGYDIGPLTASLFHNTLVGPGSGTAVYVESSYVDLALVDTIVASCTWGISQTSPAYSVVTADYTLFWANDHDGVRGTHPVDGDPAFAADGYHLMAGSAAIDRGMPDGAGTDIDGDPRQDGCGVDIGADEYLSLADCRLIRLPLVMRGN